MACVEIIRVRIVGMRECVEVCLQDVRAIPIGEYSQNPVIVACELFGYFRRSGFWKGHKGHNRIAIGWRNLTAEFFLQIIVK